MTFNIPAPQLIDPQSVPSLRWGIYGTGWISEEFAMSAIKFTNQQMTSVASRTPGKAQQFAEKVGVAEFDESYESLAARDDIDAIYIATRPERHLEDALIAINAGKHVLVEKPLTIDPDEARQLWAAAKAKGVFAMEAMWSRYLPQASVVRQIQEQGMLGKPRLLLADFCQDQRDNPARWGNNPSTPTYDMGIYMVALSIQFFGYPTRIQAMGTMHESGVVGEATATLHYADGARAIFTVSGISHAPHHATISGDVGVVEYLTPFFVPSGIKYSAAEFNVPQTTWVDDLGPVGHQGMNYEATAFASYVQQGFTESPIHPHEESVRALEIVAEIIRQVKATAS
jgi:predicted dehydrogenase